MVSSVDVARLAGVSQATVSRVMNSPEKVNTTTIDKVNDAILQLNYRPNTAARSLISKKSGIIAIVCGTLDDAENAEFSNKAIAYVQEKEFVAEIHIQNPNKTGAVFHALSTTQAEGIICGPILLSEAEQRQIELLAIPLVFCGMAPRESKNFISMDNYAAGGLAAAYVRSFNPKVVGWLGGDASKSRLQQRYQGFIDNVESKKVKIYKAAGEIAEYDSAFSTMMARKNRPTIIVAATDPIGAYAINFLRDFGYSVPEDIAVISIGNFKQSWPNTMNMSSIGLPESRDIYNEAMARLFKMIEQSQDMASYRVFVKPIICERKSSQIY